MPTRRALHAEANRLLRMGDARAGVRLFVALVRAAPQDLDARLRLADALDLAGARKDAVDAWGALLVEAAGCGHPLPAIAALKRLAAVDSAANQLFASLAERYASDARKPGPGARTSLPDGGAEVPAEAFPPAAWPDEDVLAGARPLLLGRDGLAAWPAAVPAIPLLSSLPRDAFARFLTATALRSCPEGEAVLREGEPAESFFMVARGRVAVTRGESVLATLGEGSVFGEMALLSNAPRNATVRVLEDADLLEFGRDALRAASGEVPVIAAALDRFMQQRLLSHTLATHPLFAPFPAEQRHALAARFAHQTAGVGEVLVAEGSEDAGLYIVLAGSADVTRAREGASMHLATLGPGDVFGEISVLGRVPATATVTARTPLRVLALPRAFAERLVDGVSAVRAWLSEIADARAMDTQLALSAADDDFLL